MKRPRKKDAEEEKTEMLLNRIREENENLNSALKKILKNSEAIEKQLHNEKRKNNTNQ